jgi:RecA/RadA recombinase
MSLLDKLKVAGSIQSEVMSQSAFFKPKDSCQTTVPIINAAFTGSLDGGLVSGLTVIAGPSKHFKTNLALVCVQAFMKKHPEAICIFYDSEFGVTPDYLKAHKIDGDRVLHIPVEHIEQLKFDIVKKLEEIGKKDKVIILVDSLGNLASKKEVEDAENEKSVADMSRAKAIKSLFRIITPHLTMKDIPALVINHTYETQELYSKSVVSGGTGVYYSANQIFIIGRSQEKEKDKDLTGYKYTINIEKSRFVKEKSKLPFTVDFDHGINRYSGLLDIALEIGHVKKPSNGWYSRVDVTSGEIEEKKWREADTNSNEFWLPILSKP